MSLHLVPRSEAPESLLAVIARAAADPSVDAAKMQAFMEMYDRLKLRDATTAYNESMAAAQSEMEPIVRNAFNDYIGNRHATIEAIVEGIRPIYTKHGFSARYIAPMPVRPAWVLIGCVVSLGSYSETSYLEAPIDAEGTRGRGNKTAVQAVGSTVTYLRKYLVCMAFNVVMKDDPFDDDGEGTRRPRRAKAPPTYDAPPVDLPTPDLPPDDEKPKLTKSQWLTGFYPKLAACRNEDEIDALVTKPAVLDISGRFDGQAAAIFNEMVENAYCRVRSEP